MTTLLITAVLIGVAATVYLVLVLRDEIRAAGCSWRIVVEPRPGRSPRRLRQLSAAFWGVLALGVAALALLWLKA